MQIIVLGRVRPFIIPGGSFSIDFLRNPCQGFSSKNVLACAAPSLRCERDLRPSTAKPFRQTIEVLFRYPVNEIRSAGNELVALRAVLLKLNAKHCLFDSVRPSVWPPFQLKPFCLSGMLICIDGPALARWQIEKKLFFGYWRLLCSRSIK